MTPVFRVITGETINALLQNREVAVQEIIKHAYIVHGKHGTINPDSYFLRFPDKPRNRIIALPASINDEFNISGIKWISSFPDNIRQGIPRASAVLILNKADTGYPFACLESSIISATRTASSAVLAAEYLNAGTKRVKRIGFIGNGLIARYIYRHFLGTGWLFDEVLLYDANTNESRRFGSHIDSTGMTKVIAPSCDTVAMNCDIVVFATTAAEPYVLDSCFKPRAVVLNISLRDLAPKVILEAFNVVDDLEHVMKANTSVHLTEQQQGNRDFVAGTLFDLMTANLPLDCGDRVRIFSPFGLGVLDLALGKYLYDIACDKREDIVIDGFFYE